MSEENHPVVMCDGDDGECGVVELDFTLGGLGSIVGSATQLPEGWTGTKPGDADGKHYCPACTRKRGDWEPLDENVITHTVLPWGRHKDGRWCSHHQRLGVWVFEGTKRCLRDHPTSPANYDGGL